MAQSESSSSELTGATEAATQSSRPTSDANVVGAKPLSTGSAVEHEPTPTASFEGATHFVRFSHVPDSEASGIEDEIVPIYDTHDKSSQPVINLVGDGTIHVRLIEANVGQNFSRSVIHLDPDGDTGERRFSIESIYLFPVEGITNVSFYSPEDADLASFSIDEDEVKAAVTKAGKKIKKIKDAELNVPYVENDHYNIVMDCATLSKEQYELDLPDFKKQSICKLLEFFGKKQLPEDIIQQLIQNPFGLIQSSEPYFPVRPGQNIKTKISIAKKYFESFEDMTFDDFVVDNIHNNFISTSFVVDEIDQIIERLVKILKKYDEQIAGFTGSVEGVNLNSVAEELNSFLSEFKKFLNLNDIKVGSEIGQTKFELGFDVSTFRLKYVLHFNPYGKFCSIGMSTFSGKIDPKIGKILVRHKDMFSAFSGGMSWMDFCVDFFAGYISINFTPPTDLINAAKEPLSKLQSSMDGMKANFDDLKFMTPDDAASLTTAINSPQFRETASELLMRSRDFIGDQFLVDLPNILQNVDDLSSLYTMVFDKVSVKDLLDMVLEQATAELNLPDINEIKLRGMLQALDFNLVLDTLFDNLELPDLQQIIKAICDGNTFGIKQLEDLMDSMPTVPMLALYMIHFKEDGTLGGLIPEKYEGDVLSILEQNDLADCVSLATAIANKKFKLEDYFQESAINDVICQIISEGLDTSLIGLSSVSSLQNPCPEIIETFGALGLDSLCPVKKDPSGVPYFEPIHFNNIKYDILGFIKKLDKSIVMPSIDLYMKDIFKAGADAMSLTLSGTPPDVDVPSPAAIFEKFAEIPAFKLQLDKLNLSKSQLIGKIPGLPLDFEMKKIDVDFELPSLKDCNPSFDFGKFEFSGMQDIFSGAIGGIEDAIIKGIESGLVSAFKSMLEGVLDSVSQNSTDLDSPNYGGLNMNDLLDATDGFSSDAFAGMVTNAIKEAASRFDPEFFTDLCQELIDIDSYAPNDEDSKKAIDDMSSALKPLEALRIMRGQANDRDLENMRAAIEDPAIKQLMTKDTMQGVIETVTDYVDFGMLDELEKAYSNKRIMIAVCNDRGIPYQVRDIRDSLVQKYDDLNDAEIASLIEDMVEETKDAIVDAIAAGAKGALGGDYGDNLPFNEDPCSFMPKPSDIPALDFVNSMVFDSIFDPIELEYKAEAASFADILMIPSSKPNFIKLYYSPYDFVLNSDEPYIQNEETGEYTLNLVQVDESDVYNQEFGNHINGSQTPLYEKTSAGKYVKIDDDFSSLIEKVENQEEWKIKDSSYDNIYVKSTDQKLVPIPGLKYFYDSPAASMKYSNSSRSYIITFEVDRTSPLDVRHELPKSSEVVDPNVALTIKKNTTKLVVDTFDEENPECAEGAEVTVSNNAITSGLGFIQRVSSAYRNAAQKVYTSYEEELSGIKDSIERNPESSYNTANRKTSMGVINGINVRRSMTHSIMHGFLDVLFEKISSTKLFETSYLQTFLFETDDINLLKLQDAKREAKDEYDSECTFNEDEESENKLKSSSTKKLIYLTFRLYLIEIMARSCFIFDSMYIKEMNTFLCSMLYKEMEKDLSAYPDGYYSLFKEKYEKEYGAIYPDSSSVKADNQFFKLADEIYSEISESYEELFPNAVRSNGLIEAFLDEIPIFRDKYFSFPHYCVKAFFLNNPFVIQKMRRKDYSTGDQSSSRFGEKNIKEFVVGQPEFQSDGGASGHSGESNPTIEYVYRLCYIKRMDNTYFENNFRSTPGDNGTVSSLGTLIGDAHSDRGIDSYSPRYTKVIQVDEDEFFESGIDLSEATQYGYMLAGDDSEIVQQGSQLYSFTGGNMRQAPILRASATYRFLTTTGGEFKDARADFDIVPLAETTIPSTEDGEMDTELSDREILKSMDFNSDSIYDFLKNTVEMDRLFNTILAANNSKILFDKPDVRTAFINTKLALKRAIEVLSKEDDEFDFMENETKNIQLEQSQGQSTEPDFSSKAAKMALMTIPMIIKGAAEMFDPNIKISKFIRLGADLAGYNIPPPVASLMGLPLNIIPLAPGPPITPLGLAYLATSFLEPKERKRLSDLRRGKNVNPTAGEGGGFIEGTIEEQAAAAKELAVEAVRDVVATNAALRRAYYDFYKAIENITDMIANNLSSNGGTDPRDFVNVSNVVRLPSNYQTGAPLLEVFGTGHMIFKAYEWNASPDDYIDATYSAGHFGNIGETTEDEETGVTVPKFFVSVDSPGEGVDLLDPYLEYVDHSAPTGFDDSVRVNLDNSTAPLVNIRDKVLSDDTKYYADQPNGGAQIQRHFDPYRFEPKFSGYDKRKSFFGFAANFVYWIFPHTFSKSSEDMIESGNIYYGYQKDQSKSWTLDTRWDEDYGWDDRTYPPTHPRGRYYGNTTISHIAAPHSNFYEWHSLYLKYLDKLSTFTGEEGGSARYDLFKWDSRYEGARITLSQTELFEDLATTLVGVFAAQVLSILSNSDDFSAAISGAAVGAALTGMYDSLLGSDFDDKRKAALKTATVSIPQTSPVEVESFQYVDFDQIAGEIVAAHFTGKGADIMIDSDTYNERFKERYVSKHSNVGTNWTQRHLKVSALKDAVRMLRSDVLRNIIREIENQAQSLL